MTSTETLQQRMWRTNKQLFVWTVAWLFSLALLTFGPQHLWDFAPTYSIMSMLLNAFMGFKMIVAHKRHLDSMDEMQQRIHYNAIAVSLGLSMVFGQFTDCWTARDCHTTIPTRLTFYL